MPQLQNFLAAHFLWHRSSHRRFCMEVGEAFWKGLGTPRSYSQQNSLQASTKQDAYSLFLPAHDGNSYVVFWTSRLKFGFLPFHTRIVREYAGLWGKRPKQSEIVGVWLCVFFLYFEVLTGMSVVYFWSRRVGKLTRQASSSSELVCLSHHTTRSQKKSHDT